MQATGESHGQLAALFAGLFCVWVSLFLIFRLWTRHSGDPVLKRLLWTAVLCVPFFGWLFYGGFYSRLGENDVRAEVNRDVISGGH
jgi:bacteriorhodopsin